MRESQIERERNEREQGREREAIKARAQGKISCVDSVPENDRFMLKPSVFRHVDTVGRCGHRDASTPTDRLDTSTDGVARERREPPDGRAQTYICFGERPRPRHAVLRAQVSPSASQSAGWNSFEKKQPQPQLHTLCAAVRAHFSQAGCDRMSNTCLLFNN